MMEWGRVKFSQRLIDRYLEKSPEIAEQLKISNPTHHLTSMPPTTILMINNINDSALPYHTAESLYEKLKLLYSDIPDRLKLRSLEPLQATHEMTNADYDEGCAWLIEH